MGQENIKFVNDYLKIRIKMNKTLTILGLLLIAVFLCQNIPLEAQEKKFDFYGFSQMDFVASNQSDALSGFKFKQMNLIGEYSVSDKMRVFTDLEFEGDPNLDASGGSSGAVKISRAWGEYTIFPELKIRAGKMLTPFGLYNLIHDFSASYLPVAPPLLYNKHIIPGSNGAIEQRLFGKYTLGIEATGTAELGTGSQLEYSFCVGNGRGEKSDGSDSNNNRSLSARAMYRPEFIENLQIGTSWYFDRNSSGLGGVFEDLEHSIGADIEYTKNNWTFQAETIYSTFGVKSGDRASVEVSYLLVGHTFYDRYTPYLIYSIANWEVPGDDISVNELSYTQVHAGINVSVTPNLFLKGEVQFHIPSSKTNYQMLILSAAIAF